MSTTHIAPAIALNPGDGAPEVVGHLELGGAHSGSVQLGDLNGDGDVDLVHSDSNTTTLMLGAGDGTFPCSLLYDVGGGLVALGDVNGDGRLDFIGSRLALNTPG